MVIVYDLVSENLKAIKSEYKDLLRNVRVKCIRLLHQLGVQCTESVILVGVDNQNKIIDTIHTVFRLYEDLILKIEKDLGVTLPRPIVKVIDITPEQYQIFSELAKKKLEENIDIHTDKIKTIIESKIIKNTKTVINSLKRIRKEWIRIKNQCIDLGLGLESEINNLLNLIDQAIEVLSKS